MTIIERTPPTPTYTAADAYELARRVRLDSDYDLSFTRGRADKLVLKYLEGSVESYLSPASVLWEGAYFTGKEIALNELQTPPIESADAVIYVQNRQSTEDPWSTLPGGPNAVWTWDPSSGILTVDDANEWYRVSYWYENEVLYSDLTESVDYYARRFLSDYLEIIYGEDYEYDYEKESDAGSDAGSDAVTITTKSERVTQSIPANFTVPDDLEVSINSNYSSFGNIFYSFLEYTYASIVGEQFGLEYEASEENTGTEDTGEGESADTGDKGMQRKQQDETGMFQMDEGVSGTSATNVLQELNYDY